MRVFSCFSSLTRCWSNSRMALSRSRWFLRRRSAGVMRLPKAHSRIYGAVSLSLLAVEGTAMLGDADIHVGG